MPTFLVESYQATEGPLSSRSRVPSAAFGNALGPGHRLSLLVPGEDICFHVVDGASLQAVRDSVLEAGLRCDRITEAVVLSTAARSAARGGRVRGGGRSPVTTP